MGFIFWALIGHSECEPAVKAMAEKESSLKVLEFISNLRKQREEELKRLRFEVSSLRMIMKAKADWKLK